QRLHLYLCVARRDLRLGRGVEPDPRIFAGRLGRRRGLVRVRHSLPGRAGRRPAAGPDGRPARRGRPYQPAGGLHHRRCHRPAADGHQGKRDAERRAGAGEDRRPGGLRRHRFAELRRRQLHPLHAQRLWRALCPDGTPARPVHRHHRFDGGLHHSVHRRRRRCDRRRPGRQLRRQPRAAGSHHARPGPGRRRPVDRRRRRDRPADRAAGLPVRPEPHLPGHGPGRSAAQSPGQDLQSRRADRGDDLHRRRRRLPGGHHASGRTGVAGQRRHPDGLHGRGDQPDRAARARAEPRTEVQGAAVVAGRRHRHRRLHRLLLQPEELDAAVFPAVEPVRPGRLPGLVVARDLSGAVDFTVLEAMTGGMDEVTEEVLGLFAEQARMWSALLDASSEGWRDAVHTIRGAGAGIGAKALAEICAEVEHGEQAAASAGLER
uniref:HPt domain-containing protein n=1 Tax=Parastrongyloides trichosuri TaxID=131310 RepID=A0A0N5A6D7_PARTI